MRAINGSYFDRELCLDGHYIVTGYINDQFCNDLLQLTDVKYEIHHYLRHKQGFDAVIFLDSVNMLFCYDQESFDILRGNESVSDAHSSENSVNRKIIEGSPLTHSRRRRRDNTTIGTSENKSKHSEPIGPWHMGRQAIRVAWEQVTALLRFSKYRCALVLSNVDSLISTMGIQEMAILEELQSYHSTNQSIVIYMFRETSISSLVDSVNYSLGGATNQWARFVQNVLLKRIESDTPEENRVISLRTPNRNEVLNLLNYLRLHENPRSSFKLEISKKDIPLVAKELAASCTRQKWGLRNLINRLERHVSENPGKQLNAGNWKEFTGETGYRTPIEQLNGLIGLQNVKKQIEEWYKLQLQRKHEENSTDREYSRLTPLPERGGVRGHALNIKIKGRPGTGKTTVARLMGQLYYQLALLPQGHLVECSASDLVSENVGGTAGLVRSRVQEAMGGVLFIDEAYSLATNQHGREAINQLVNDMSRYEGQFAVVLAGYPTAIDRLMRENDGLAGRFPNEYVLNDYTPDEMRQIFEKMAEGDKDNVVISDELRAVLPTFCEAWVGGKTRGWRNAGEAENLLTAMKKRCGVRMHETGEGNKGAFLLSPLDIPENLQHCLSSRSNNLQEALDEIDKMIGLANVKTFLKDLSRNILWKVEEPAPGNYIFFGPPGTGKTTVARRMGEILGHLGVLGRTVNNVTECKAAELLNGQSTLTELVEDARGGILFIDEAHQLEQNERGHAIIRELVPLIEDPEIHADTCFILAGYTAEMKKFLNVDKGLSRRFPRNHRIRFDDYTASELIQILERMARERGERTDCPEFKAYLSRSKVAIEKFLEHKPQNFGNGGFIRDEYLPESIVARTERLDRKYRGEDGFITKEKVECVSSDERKTLTEEDIPKAFRQFAGPVGRKPQGDRNTKALLAELYGKESFVEYIQSLMGDETSQQFYDGKTNVGMHYSIVGPEGSGRHTSIRVMAMARKELGYLEKDDVLFVSKADLEAGYVGQTAIKTQNVIEQAIGGTLVVSYPSMMLPKNANDNSFGPEALGVIVSAMSEHFNDLCVVFLDAQEGMDEVLKVFPTVRSSLSRQFVFEDLSYEDMYQIFMHKTADSMVFDDELKSLMQDIFLNWVSDRGGLGDEVSTWGNGKEVDQLIEELIQNWKCNDGKVVTDELTENGASYSVRKRYITRDMFPKGMNKYMVPNRIVSENALEQLQSLTGLQRVKESVRRIERRLRMNPNGTVNPGLYCFVGNPGVGKTTVAKLMGGILKATGALSQGHVIVRTARQMSDNVGDFDKTIKLAKNGILFIDEAHQLADPTNIFGRDVIKKLLTVLEDSEVIRNTCIILAGYPREMAGLLQVDSGLASRFGTANSIIRFDDYSPDELEEILESMAAKADRIIQIGVAFPLRLSEDYKAASRKIFQSVVSAGNADFGNARFVRNYLSDSVDEMFERVDTQTEVFTSDHKEIDLLTEKDVPKKYRNILLKEKKQVIIPSVDIVSDNAKAIAEGNLNDVLKDYSQSIVYLEVYRNGALSGEGTGTIITKTGYILTCAHVVKGADRIRARIFSPGMIGGDYRWFECTITNLVLDECDMAVIQMDGENFIPLCIRPRNLSLEVGESTVLIGYPLGKLINGENTEALQPSIFSGSIASHQSINGVNRFYIDSTGLHGNSGSPVISTTDGRMIGVFSGSIIPDREDSLDELNFFYPIEYFWENYVI